MCNSQILRIVFDFLSVAVESISDFQRAPRPLGPAKILEIPPVSAIGVSTIGKGRVDRGLSLWDFRTNARLAATNKCLAQSNKSRKGGKATKKRTGACAGTGRAPSPPSDGKARLGALKFMEAKMKTLLKPLAIAAALVATVIPAAAGEYIPNSVALAAMQYKFDDSKESILLKGAFIGQYHYRCYPEPRGAFRC
jgi:hypothetical protein